MIDPQSKTNVLSTNAVKKNTYVLGGGVFTQKRFQTTNVRECIALGVYRVGAGLLSQTIYVQDMGHVSRKHLIVWLVIRNPECLQQTFFMG